MKARSACLQKQKMPTDSVNIIRDQEHLVGGMI